MTIRNIIPALLAICLLCAQTAAAVHEADHLFHEYDVACDSFVSIEKSPANHFQSHSFVDVEIDYDLKMPIEYIFTAQMVFSSSIRGPPAFPEFI